MLQAATGLLQDCSSQLQDSYRKLLQAAAGCAAARRRQLQATAASRRISSRTAPAAAERVPPVQLHGNTHDGVILRSGRAPGRTFRYLNRLTRLDTTKYLNSHNRPHCIQTIAAHVHERDTSSARSYGAHGGVTTPDVQLLIRARLVHRLQVQAEQRTQAGGHRAHPHPTSDQPGKAPSDLSRIVFRPALPTAAAAPAAVDDGSSSRLPTAASSSACDIASSPRRRAAGPQPSSFEPMPTIDDQADGRRANSGQMC